MEPPQRALLVVAEGQRGALKQALESAGLHVDMADEPPRPSRQLPYDVIVAPWSPQWQAILERATVTPEFVDVSHELQPDFVQVLSRGVKGRWCPEPEVLGRVMGPRNRRSQRVPAAALTVRWAGSPVSFRVLECSSHGLSFFVPADGLDWSVRRHTVLRNLRIELDRSLVLEPQSAQIVQISFAEKGFRVGCRLGRSEDAPATEISQPEQIAALIAKGSMLRGIKLLSLEREEAHLSNPGPASYSPQTLTFSQAEHPFEELEALEGRFHLDARLHRFVTVVISRNPLALRSPRRLLATERRQRSRARTQNLHVTVVSPLASGTPHEGSVVDVSGHGLSIEVDDALPWPVGLRLTLTDFVGAGTGSLPHKVIAVVRSYGAGGGGRARVGLAFVALSNYESAAFANLVGGLEADITDGRNCGFDALWKLFRTAGLVSDEQAQEFEPHLGAIRDTYGKLFAAPPTLYMSRVVLKAQEPIAHMSAIRLYQRSWYVFQQAARLSSRRASFDMNRAFVATLEQLEHAEMLRITYAEANKWTGRIYSTFIRRVASPARSAMRTLTVLQISKNDSVQAPADAQVTVTPRAQWPALLESIRRHEDVLAAEALDLHEGELELPTVSVQYHAFGLDRRRTPLTVDVGGRRAAYALVEDSTPWLDFRGQLSTVMIWHTDSKATALNDEATRAIIAHVLKQRTGAAAATFTVFLRSRDAPLPNLTEIAHPPIRAVDLTVRRDVYAIFVDYIRELGVRYSGAAGDRDA